MDEIIRRQGALKDVVVQFRDALVYFELDRSARFLVDDDPVVVAGADVRSDKRVADAVARNTRQLDRIASVVRNESALTVALHGAQSNAGHLAKVLPAGNVDFVELPIKVVADALVSLGQSRRRHVLAIAHDVGFEVSQDGIEEREILFHLTGRSDQDDALVCLLEILRRRKDVGAGTLGTWFGARVHLAQVA